MVDWLWRVAQWLEVNVISMPLYIAAPAMVIIGALDSSLLSLPEINDYLVVGRCYKYPSAAFYFPLFAPAVATKILNGNGGGSIAGIPMARNPNRSYALSTRLI